jgi:hypothetical protein
MSQELFNFKVSFSCVPQSQQFDPRRPLAEKSAHFYAKAPLSGQTSLNSQKGDNLVPRFTEPKGPLLQESLFVQEPQVIVHQELIVPSPPVTSGAHLTRTQKPGRYRPGPQGFKYPEDSCIHQSILASKGQLTHTAPHKSVRFYPHGTEASDLTRAFAPSSNSSTRLVEIHQLYSDQSLQVTRLSEKGYHLSVQRLANPKD